MEKRCSEAASACVFLKTSNMSFFDPHPPDAITGILILSQIALISSRSYPFSVPSASILVSNISPAPSFSTFFTHSIASIFVDFFPPYVLISNQ